MTRIFRSGEEIKVFIDEEFDIRIDDAPPETIARPVGVERLITTESNGVRQKDTVTFFHFKAFAAGIQKIEFPPTMLTQNVEIENLIGVPNVESDAESVAIELDPEINPPPLADA